MLNMIVMTHGPNICAGVNPESRGKASNGFGQLNAAAQAKDIAVQGAWGDAPGAPYSMRWLMRPTRT